MYSLLNYIAATSKDIFESGTLYPHPYGPHHRSLHGTPDIGSRELSDDEKRMVGVSTISAVTRLALEFKMEEVGCFAIIQTMFGLLEVF
jgi:phosphatidylinositol 4-kinase